ncbi:uncharacterized protein LOC113376024 [Ctenocephalides felis]|uniref:uncharacterized protein LOC113367353 n=1 Tax=Ctenocephalides felis TaxID=7515 RepID=UPI000E6E3A92|nr:uncharacterized protein LOC113367353 [Ctenocephalides felis]XP_026471741.1 uncharacterized protein LOC113376024 [Ctenocephalides felis]
MFCKDYVNIELHGFADASERAYGACVYIRSANKNSNFKIQLITSKSRVAPLRNITLPRLELCAAHLLANLIQKIKTALNINFDREFFWSDSTVALSWIKSPSYRWKTFVANRVADIQTKTDINNWLHVKSQDNPADLISRGIFARDLINSSLWWNGPSWLRYPIKIDQHNNNIPTTDEESRTTTLISIIDETNELFNRYSSITKLIRVVAHCLRFSNNCRPKKKVRVRGPLQVCELNISRMLLIKLSQNEAFKKDISNIIKNGSVDKTSNLKTLNPFLDENGILRVGGRLKNSNIGYSKRHPIVLPKKHILTTLIAKYEHLRLYHCGSQMLLNTLRNNYWPMGGRNLTRNIVKNCITCFKVKPTSINPLMGNLPTHRITPQTPFSTCGVDYGGPIILRDRRTRGYKKYKAYICLFVCFVTKAIHIELVSDLTAECFLAALRRFTARRGKPSDIFSDNGTNFVGANSELNELSKFLQNKSIKSTITNNLSIESISWHYIPANSPHFGGLWEAGIKSCKAHLKRVLGNACLTFEEFYTVLTQIEAILNSRPLSPLSSDPNDYNPLTPGHFLIGKPPTSIPDPCVLEIPENRLSCYQRLQRLTQHFWKRWYKEYISELQVRTKWHKYSSELIKVGNMVLLRDENLPPLRWRLGRIITLHPGEDGIVRVITVKTNNNLVKRAVSRICVLPIDDK